jgi:hypothetical protein
MFDIKEIDVMGQTNKLLFNIWQELKKPQEVKPAELCEYCGKDHSNKGYAMACARKRKKESGSDV